jgi:hypothetical protein
MGRCSRTRSRGPHARLSGGGPAPTAPARSPSVVRWSRWQCEASVVVIACDQKPVGTAPCDAEPSSYLRPPKWSPIPLELVVLPLPVGVVERVAPVCGSDRYRPIEVDARVGMQPRRFVTRCTRRVWRWSASARISCTAADSPCRVLGERSRFRNEQAQLRTVEDRVIVRIGKPEQVRAAGWGGAVAVVLRG